MLVIDDVLDDVTPNVQSVILEVTSSSSVRSLVTGCCVAARRKLVRRSALCTVRNRIPYGHVDGHGHGHGHSVLKFRGGWYRS